MKGDPDEVKASEDSTKPVTVDGTPPEEEAQPSLVGSVIAEEDLDAPTGEPWSADQ